MKLTTLTAVLCFLSGAVSVPAADKPNIIVIIADDLGYADVSFNTHHAPLQAPADEIAKFNTGNKDRDTRLAMGKRTDAAVGKVIATLQREKIWNNTLVFFLSDNGGPLAQSADNTPLRGGKHQDYEGGIRVPFLVCWPGKLQAGESQAVVSSLDILPTCLSAAAVIPPDDKPLDGLNLLPVLRGESSASERNLFWCSGSEEGWWAVRSGDWKLVARHDNVELFDLARDVSESNDLANAMPDKVADLTRLHDKWLTQMDKPVKTGEKKWTTGLPAAKKKKLTRDEKQKARKDARPTK